MVSNLSSALLCQPSILDLCIANCVCKILSSLWITFFQRALTHAHRISHTVFTSLLTLVQLATQMPHVLTVVGCTSENTGLELFGDLFFPNAYTHWYTVQVLCPSKIVKVMDAVGVH